MSELDVAWSGRGDVGRHPDGEDAVRLRCPYWGQTGAQEVIERCTRHGATFYRRLSLTVGKNRFSKKHGPRGFYPNAPRVSSYAGPRKPFTRLAGWALTIRLSGSKSA